MKLLLFLSLVLSFMISLVSSNPLLSQELDGIAKEAFKKEIEELKEIKRKSRAREGAETRKGRGIASRDRKESIRSARPARLFFVAKNQIPA